MIQAWYAPLVKVYDTPQSPHSTITTTGELTTPTRTQAVPIPTKPMTRESRRLYVSATTPVGTSDRKTAPSIAVPISTSCNGVRFRSLTRYRDMTIHVGVESTSSSA